jgi:hypothetical protein
MTAQDVYKSLLRDQVGPALRGLGYLGSGRNWRLVGPEGNAAYLNFQADRYSTPAEVGFTVNLDVWPTRSWEWYSRCCWGSSGAPAQKRPSNGHPAPFSSRIGHLDPTRRTDHWWTVRAERDPTAAGDDLLRVITGVTPRLRELTDTANLVDCLWTTAGQGPGPRVWELLHLSVLMDPTDPRWHSVLEQLDLLARTDPRPPWLPQHVAALHENRPLPVYSWT